MRRILVTLAVSALAGPILAAGAHAAPALGKSTGDVTFDGGNQDAISFTAHDLGEAGDKGQVTYTNNSAGFTYTAEVTNAVVDNEAKTACFTYTIPTDSDAPDGIEGLVITFHVADGGTPGTAGDAIGYTVGTSCTTAASAAVPVTGGNLVVHKAK